jgi:hypothetical protein
MLEDETINSAPNETVDSGPARDGDTEDMMPVRGVQSPPTIHRVSRRPMGVGPVRLLGGGLVLALLLAIVLIAVGAWVVGVVLLACALILVALLLVAVEHEPDDPAAQAAITAADRARSQTRLIGVAARAWSRAGLAVVRFRQRRYRLRWRLRRQLEPLGEAAFRGDEARVERLRGQAQRMEEALRQTERETAAAVQAARDEIERERAFSERTQSLPVQDPPDGAE